MSEEEDANETVTMKICLVSTFIITLIFLTLYILEPPKFNQHAIKTGFKTFSIVYICFEVVLLLVFYNCYSADSNKAMGHSRQVHRVIDEIYGMTHHHIGELW